MEYAPTKQTQSAPTTPSLPKKEKETETLLQQVKKVFDTPIDGTHQNLAASQPTTESSVISEEASAVYVVAFREPSYVKRGSTDVNFHSSGFLQRYYQLAQQIPLGFFYHTYVAEQNSRIIFYRIF